VQVAEQQYSIAELVAGNARFLRKNIWGKYRSRHGEDARTPHMHIIRPHKEKAERKARAKSRQQARCSCLASPSRHEQIEVD
jgi:hypothetical protein